MEPRGSYGPANLRERVAQVDEVVAVAQRRGTRRRRGARPQIHRIEIRLAAYSDELDLLARSAVQRELEPRARDAALRRGPSAVIVDGSFERLPAFAEKERRARRRGLRLRKHIPPGARGDERRANHETSDHG